MTSRLRADGALSLFCGLLALGYLFSVQRIPSPQIVDPIGPRTFPVLIGCGLLLASGLLLLESSIGRRDKENRSAMPCRKELFGLLVLTLLYYLVFDWLGYLLATFGYLTTLLLALNRGKVAWNVALALAFSVGLYLLFDKCLGVQMPRGVLPF